MTAPNILPQWSALTKHQGDIKTLSLRHVLDGAGRFKALSHSVENMIFDFSKHLITTETRTLLLDLAKAMNIEKRRDAMFTGEKINNTESRSVLHTALRAPKNATVMVDGENIMPFVFEVLEQMRAFSDRIRFEKKIKDVVNIGIGGSDLGPRFVVDALQDFTEDGPNIHFVSNVDGADIAKTLRHLDVSTTLFIIASKTFTTEETMLNAGVAKAWFLEKATTEKISDHFVALSTNKKGVLDFGILEENMFPFRDWVGGRYSIWSAIGLSIALAVGFKNYRAMLDGAHAMDTHFRMAPLESNIPVLMGMLGIWYRNFFDYPAHLLLAYDARLGRITKYTQQMDMESNGKAVDRDGQAVSYATGPIIFGEPGTDSQHSFMQFVHQSPQPIPADFIICKKPAHSLQGNHQCLMANFLAQTKALAIGQTLEEANGDASRVFSGNRPSTSIILPELTPFTLGALIAAYEHKVFVQGVVWNLNSYDQPGVELGKKLSVQIAHALKDKKTEDKKTDAAMDDSTKGLFAALMS